MDYIEGIAEDSPPNYSTQKGQLSPLHLSPQMGLSILTSLPSLYSQILSLPVFFHMYIIIQYVYVHVHVYIRTCMICIIHLQKGCVCVCATACKLY